MSVTELEPGTVVDLSDRINDNASNGNNGNIINEQTEQKPRWSETNHVFATPHPAHELIPSQTAYGRDITDPETKEVVSKTPAGFSRIMLPNLLPTDRMEEAERLCKIHNVDLRDEFRYAMLQIMEAVITELENRPIPADYKGESKRLNSEEKNRLKEVEAAKKAEIKRLREEGKAIREKIAAERKKAIEEYNRKMAELTGKPIPADDETEGSDQTAAERLGLPTLGEVQPPNDSPVPVLSQPITVPDEEVNQDGNQTNQKKGGKK